MLNNFSQDKKLFIENLSRCNFALPLTAANQRGVFSILVAEWLNLPIQLVAKINQGRLEDKRYFEETND